MNDWQLRHETRQKRNYFLSAKTRPPPPAERGQLLTNDNDAWERPQNEEFHPEEMHQNGPPSTLTGVLM